MPFQDDLNDWYNPADRVRQSMAGPDRIINDQMSDDRRRIGQQLTGRNPWQTAPQVGANPYESDLQSYLARLQAQSRGEGPSLAQDAYRTGSQDAMAQQSGLARIGGAAGARQASMNAARIQQGMTQGLTQARTAEQLGAMGQLGGAINSAGQQAFQRDALNAQLTAGANQGNQSAYLNLLAQQLGISVEQLRGMLGQSGVELGAAALPKGMDKLLTAAGTVGGFIVGGPGGAVVGNQAGSAAGDAMK